MEKIEKLDYTNACTCSTKSDEKNLTNRIHTTQCIPYNQTTAENNEDVKGVFMIENPSNTSDTPSNQPFIPVKYSDTPSNQPFIPVKYSDTSSNQLSSSVKYSDQANINDPSVESSVKTIQINKLSQEKQSNQNNSPESTDVNRISVELPCSPEKPGDSDCCGSGCVPCVFDIYDQEVKIWKQECAKIKNKAVFGDNCLVRKV